MNKITSVVNNVLFYFIRTFFLKLFCIYWVIYCILASVIYTYMLDGRLNCLIMLKRGENVVNLL